MMRRPSRLAIFFLLLLALPAAGGAARPPLRARLVRLPLLPGTVFSSAFDINDAGVAVGQCVVVPDPEGQSRQLPVRWRNGRVEMLSLLPGFPQGSARAIDALGRIAGTLRNADGFAVAVLWVGNRVLPLDTPAGGAFARAMNNRGLVAGEVTGPNSQNPAAYWVGQRLHVLPLLPGASFASVSAINFGGRMGGVISGENGFVPTLWQGSRLTVLPLPPGATDGDVQDLNDGNLAVGIVFPGGTRRIVAWQGTRLLLPPLPAGALSSAAWAVNNNGQIVGEAVLPELGTQTYLWEGNELTNLSALLPTGAVDSLSPSAINNPGQVVGLGFQGDAGFAFRLDTFRSP